MQQLLLFVSSIHNSLESKTQTDVIYLDFKKAFDSVPHGELLFKLHSIGITGNLWKWFEYYLSFHLQCVAVDDEVSELLSVKSGVPQGSILGPILFLIYINDLPNSVSSPMYIFADDTKCAKHIQSAEDSVLLKNDLDSLYEWYHKWKKKFNNHKCLLLQFCSNFQTSYTINGCKLEVLESHRDLGVIINKDLSWSDQYKHISGRAYKLLGLLRRTFGNSASITTKKTLYLSLVRSQLVYCSQLWRPYLINHIVQLERIQRRATRFIVNNSQLNYKERLEALHLLPLMMWFELNDIMFFIKQLKNPSTNFNILEFVSFSNSTTRLSNVKMNHLRSKSNRSRHFYFNRLPRLWNALPELDLSLSHLTLKSKLKDLFWSSFISNFVQDKPCTYHYLCPCNKCIALPPHLYVSLCS